MNPNKLFACWPALVLAGLTVLANEARGFDNTWDWAGGARYLQLILDPSLVNPLRGASVDSQLGGMPLADANPANGNFFVQDAVVRAMGAWNLANTGWTISTAPAPAGVKFATITVRMGSLATDNEPNSLNPGQDEFARPPSVGGVPFDPNNGNGGVNPGPGVPALAIFMRTGGNNAPNSAQIIFNNMVSWGVDKNNQGTPGNPVDAFFDPTMVALHELGHAMRLDHAGNFMIGDPAEPGGTIDGNVMRPGLFPGFHAINADMNYARNPGAGDIADATASAVVVPEPSSASMCLIGLASFLTIRRRRR
jgi:hypothetical protein